MSCCVDTQSNVAMGEVKLARDTESLIAVLGSCIGVAIYDPQLHIGAFAHIVLPDSHGKKEMPGKFADTAIPHMIESLQDASASPDRLVAKMVGGANMFGRSGPLQISQNNADAVVQALASAGVKLVAQHLGGSKGRRVTLNCATGELTIEIVACQPTVI